MAGSGFHGPLEACLRPLECPGTFPGTYVHETFVSGRLDILPKCQEAVSSCQKVVSEAGFDLKIFVPNGALPMGKSRDEMPLFSLLFYFFYFFLFCVFFF